MSNGCRFTRKYNGRQPVLTLPVKITIVGGQGEYETNGIIDTGATNSVVSKNVAKVLGAVPETFTFVHTASSQSEASPVYEAVINIDNRVIMTGLKVTEGVLLPGAECLIGMDILTRGDLAVTSFRGETCFSFRVPSEETIDYVEHRRGIPETPYLATRMQGRNDPCACGSGKKYKDCHGKNK
jgi:predicted aspartyl protease